jgi:hypothetical protein
MAILEVKTESLGQPGVIPKLIYIATSDTTAGVQVPNYLDVIVKGGISLDESDMAIVSVTDGKYVDFFNVVYTPNNHWSLSLYGGAEGTNWLTDGQNSGAGLLLGTNSANGFSIVSNNILVATFDAAGNVTLGQNATTINIGNGSTANTIIIGNLSTGSTTALEGGSISLDGTIDIIQDAPAIEIAPNVCTSLEISNSSCTTTFDGTNFYMPNLPFIQTTTMVYYNPETGRFTYSGQGEGGGVVWNNVTTSPVGVLPGNGYIVSTSANVQFILPSVCPFGTVFEIVGRFGSGWTLTQADGQEVHLGTAGTTVGVTGSIASTETYDCIRVVCTVANTEFEVVSSMGNFLIT